MQPIILVATPAHPRLQAGLDAGYAVHHLPADADARGALLADIGPTVRAVVTTNSFGLPIDIAERLPALEIVGVSGVGVDSVDLDHARARGYRVTNTPDVLNEDVADLAIALWLSVLRRLPTADRFIRQGRWAAGEAFPLTRRASGGRVGILGLGRIGSAIARRAEPFAGEIAYHNRRHAPESSYRYFPELVELARWADVLFVITPGGLDTHHLVDGEVLEALGVSGVLVNVARGSVVDETALVEALASGRLGGAGLDVFADEPAVPQALLAMDNVVLQPHLGSATVETRAAMADLVLANLAAHFDGRPLLTPVA